MPGRPISRPANALSDRWTMPSGKCPTTTDFPLATCVFRHDRASHTPFATVGRKIDALETSRLAQILSRAALEMMMTDAGLTRVMSYKMEAAAREGKLAVVLEEFGEEPLPVHLVNAERKPVPLKL